MPIKTEDSFQVISNFTITFFFPQQGYQLTRTDSREWFIKKPFFGTLSLLSTDAWLDGYQQQFFLRCALLPKNTIETFHDLIMTCHIPILIPLEISIFSNIHILIATCVDRQNCHTHRDTSSALISCPAKDFWHYLALPAGVITSQYPSFHTLCSFLGMAFAIFCQKSAETNQPWLRIEKTNISNNNNNNNITIIKIEKNLPSLLLLYLLPLPLKDYEIKTLASNSLS